MAKMPRPEIRDQKYRAYTYHGVNSFGGVIYYPAFSTTLKVYEIVKQFPTSPSSPKGTRALNAMPGSAIQETRWVPRIRRPKNDSSGRTRVYSQGVIVVNDDNESFVRQAAINKFIASIQENKSQLLLVFAERRRTIEMVANRVWQAYYLLRALKRGDLNKARNIASNGKANSKKGAGAHLEIQYGWLQLTNEIYTLCAKPLVPIPSRRLKVSYSRPFGGFAAIVSAEGSDQPSGQKSWRGETRYVVQADVELDMPFVASASVLGLTNPAFVAWDLLPYSLLIDWFVPIGPYLEHLTALDGFIVKDKLLSKRTAFESYIETDSGNTHHQSKYFQRTKSFDLKYSPLIKNPLSVTHALNGLAMLRQHFGGANGKPFKKVF